MAEHHHRTRTRLEPAVRRRQIAAAAARVFATREPSEVSFEAVADEAGVSRSLVYSYFHDRGSLFAAAYSHELDLLDAEIGDAVERFDSDRDRLEQMVRAYLRFAWQHRDTWQLIVSAGASRHPAVRAAMRDRLDRIADAILAGATGGLPGEAETRLLVRAVVGMLESAAMYSLDAAPNGSADEIDPDELADVLLSVLWGGLSSRGRV